MAFPGVSLFQGSDSIKIDGNNHDQEEEEFLAEEKQRKAELNKLFRNAFDDLIDDEDADDSSVCSSQASNRFEPMRSGYSEDSNGELRGTPQHPGGHLYYGSNGQNNFVEPQAFPVEITSSDKGAKGDGNYYNEVSHDYRTFHPTTYQQHTEANDIALEKYKHSDYNSTAQLQVLYDVRVREIERLNKELAEERASKEQLARKLAISETEKNGILSSLNQNHALLAKSKEVVTNLEEQVVALKGEISKLEKIRDENKNELSIAKLQILNLEQNMAMMERCDTRANREKQIDGIIDSINSKHQKELNSIQQELHEALEKIRQKDEAYKALERSLEDLEKKHVNTLLNKCDSTVRQEAAVKNLLDQVTEEKTQLIKKHELLKMEYLSMREELERYEKLAEFNLQGISSDDQDTDSITMMELGNNRQSGGSIRNKVNLSQTDMISKLKDELHRAMMGQRNKRQEIKQLQQQVQMKEAEILKMRDKEKTYLDQMDSLKRDLNLTMEKLSHVSNGAIEEQHLREVNQLKEELKKVNEEKKNVSTRVIDLENCVEHLRHKLEEKEIASCKQQEEYLRFHDREIEKLKIESQNILEDKQKEWKIKLEEQITECNEVKQFYLELRSSKELLAQQLEEERSTLISTKKEKEALNKQIEFLKKNIDNLEDHIYKLNEERNNLEEKLRSYMSASSNSTISELRSDLERLRREMEESKIEDKKHCEVEEIVLAKKKYDEIKKDLQDAFETNMKEVRDENRRLKSELAERQKEVSRKEEQLQIRTASVMTDMNDINFCERINEKTIEEIDKLEKEVSRLKELEIKKTDEIMLLKANFQKQLEHELEDLETKLTAKHLEDLKASEEIVKKLTLKYFTEEMEKLRNLHKEELHTVRQQEAHKYEEIKKMLSSKEDEIKQNIELKKQVVILQNTIAEKTSNAAYMMAHWAKEAQEIKEQSEDNLKEIERLRAKLKTARKAALSYKKRLEQSRGKYIEQYETLINDLKKRFETAVVTKEEEISKKLQEIEDVYKIKKNQMLKVNVT